MTPSTDGSVGAARFQPPPRAESGWFRRALGRGEVLYREGDRGGIVYRVDEGLLKVAVDTPAGRERILTLAGPGDLLGTLVSDGRSLQESAQTLSEQALVSTIRGSRLLAEDADELISGAAREASLLREALADSELPVAARLARTLLRLGCRFGHRGEDGAIWLSLPLTHEHLAAMIGAARETTSSALGRLRAEGLISGSRGRYRLERAGLERFVLETAV